jgi:hypothetical protein
VTVYTVSRRLKSQVDCLNSTRAESVHRLDFAQHWRESERSRKRKAEEMDEGSSAEKENIAGMENRRRLH